MSKGSTPRHAQTAGDLGFAVQFNGISRSSAILGSDNPQRNNGKGNSIHSPCERPNVIKHVIAGYFRLPRPTPAPALMRVLHWLRCLVEEPGLPLAIHPKIMARYGDAAAALR